MIELRQFRQFIAVAEELSFRRAALRLRMAQPPLTAAIKKMESELGVLLIERSNRIARLTEAGRVFLEEARRAVAQADRALNAAQRAGAGLSGSLRVNFVPSVAHDLLPRILRAFGDAHSGIDLNLGEATTAQQVAALTEDRADIGFVMPPLHNAEGLSIDVLLRDQLVVALPEGHRLANRRSMTLAHLADERWILFPARHGPGLYGRVLSACAKAGFVPRAAQETMQMDTIASFVAGGIGLALVPASLAALGRRGVVFRRPSGTGAPVDYELALAYRTRSPALDAFASVAHAVVKKSYPAALREASGDASGTDQAS
jgi:DNA-binding transcriptional LysR family regulator